MDTEQITLPAKKWAEVQCALHNQEQEPLATQLRRVIIRSGAWLEPLTLTYPPEEAALIRETAHALGIELEE